MVGLEGRTSLLVNLSKALSSNSEFFGHDARPGNIVGEEASIVDPGFKRANPRASDFLEKESKVLEGKTVVPIAAVWHLLITGLSVIWPSRLSLAGVSLGDVWPCTSLKNSLPEAGFEEGDDLVPFHKLTGWTTYSLLEPMEKILGWKFDGIDDMTGLPEYRNGECLPDRWRALRALGCQDFLCAAVWNADVSAVSLSTGFLDERSFCVQVAC